MDYGVSMIFGYTYVFDRKRAYLSAYNFANFAFVRTSKPNIIFKLVEGRSQKKVWNFP